MATTTTTTTVIIVGAGPTGLSVAATLTNQLIPYILLEREDCFASIWKKYSYDRLQLHLPKQACQLPLKPFPSHYPTYVPRDLFLTYLDDYVSHFKINPKYHSFVENADFDQGIKRWKVVAKNSSSGELDEYSSEFLVVATGETSDAFVPEVEGLDTFPGEVIHSTRFKNGKPYAKKNVLVVGSGNSGMEIALDLSLHGASTSIAIRSPIHILSKWMALLGLGLVALKFIPFHIVDSSLVILSKIFYGDLSKFGIQRPEETPFVLKVRDGKYPVFDCGTFERIKSGHIQVLSGVSKFKGNEVKFLDGKTHSFDAIIFATGFTRSTNKWLKGDDYLLNEDGLPKPQFPNHWKGKNGLYCAGLARRGLYGGSVDAGNIANDIHTILNSS